MKQTVATKTLLACLISVLAVSCVNVKAYQKSRINDAEMVLSNRAVEKNELNVQSYKEGSSGANAGKTGGGVRLQLIC